ncbi:MULTISPECIES: ATP-binding protein [Streptomyces]|uniref:Histidine kinase/HSP90-like ATPase domain-containing protein n=2 Tax=Streptomyces TaxID=1883 RepID=Q9K4K1_STRCO|nr:MULTISPECIES: ATP-binding protein [Streptomyces]MDX2927328.1 ATP-binding protein [Streptomyces sp. NRRL_B-16638]MDX3409575.1 ATP-binding protein [Streptomyces sp. ME02-6977A]MYU46818.1 ATP-binding protein [Streptomyces sp. SID7813]NSL83881.1 ATP-binding protein [Streptomyces coelicolor]QFI47057.1 ATP-binding protein [Streptomyces coelicolor A3(2)]
MRDRDTIQPVVEQRGGDTGRRYRPCRPADARAAVERAVTECRGAGGRASCDPCALSDAVLVASELTTNAILHGGGITDFQVDVVGPGVRLSVCDRSHDLPVAVPATDDRGRRRLGGRGWPIVCRLAREVRVADLPSGGKCITVVVPLS